MNHKFQKKILLLNFSPDILILLDSLMSSDRKIVVLCDHLTLMWDSPTRPSLLLRLVLRPNCFQLFDDEAIEDQNQTERRRKAEDKCVKDKSACRVVTLRTVLC